jgi:hypothetical protein
MKMTLRWWALAVCLALPAIVWTRAEAPAAKVALLTSVEPTKRDMAAMPLPAAPPAQVVERSTYAVESAVQRARANGEGEDAAYRLRAAALSTRMIAMLTEREQAEQQWMGRVDAWRAQRAMLNPADGAALQALRKRLFSDDEQTRLDTYEQSATPQLILH